MHIGIDRIGAVDFTGLLVRENRRFFGSGDEINSVPPFPIVPLFEVQRGAVIRIDDFSASLRSLTQYRWWQGLQHCHVVMIALLLHCAEIQVAHPPIAQIAGIEVGHAEPAAVDRLIVAGMLMAVAVASVYIEPIQLWKLRQRIGKLPSAQVT